MVNTGIINIKYEIINYALMSQYLLFHIVSQYIFLIMINVPTTL